MQEVEIKINTTLNVSIQVADILYGTATTGGQSGINHKRGTQAPIKIGIITKVHHANSTVYVKTDISPDLINKYYLFFNKNKAVSLSGVLGYYALTEYRNYSKNKAEIFATGTEYAPSSK